MSPTTEDKIISLFDKIRLGSIITVVGCVGALVSLIFGDLTYLEFAAALGLSGVGGGAIGIARNGAGHGIH